MKSDVEIAKLYLVGAAKRLDQVAVEPVRREKDRLEEWMEKAKSSEERAEVRGRMIDLSRLAAKMDLRKYSELIMEAASMVEKDEASAQEIRAMAVRIEHERKGLSK